MATIDLGKIKLVWRGTYSGGTAYTVDDVVQHTDGGITSSFICTTNSTGNAPSTGGSVHSSWAYLAKGSGDATLTTRGDVLYYGASGLARLGAGTSGQFLKTQGANADPVWGTVVSKLLQAQHYTEAGRSNVNAVASDQDLKQWTTSFVKQSATSKLYMWCIIPTHGSHQGSQQIYQKFAHTDGTTTEVYGSRIYQYSANQNSTVIGMQGVATGLKTGTYTINTYASSMGNNHNGQFVMNPNASDDNRYEYSGGAQGNTGAAGSQSTLIVQEIEV